jgi:hypothetical protein
VVCAGDGKITEEAGCSRLAGALCMSEAGWEVQVVNCMNNEASNKYVDPV